MNNTYPAPLNQNPNGKAVASASAPVTLDEAASTGSGAVRVGTTSTKFFETFGAWPNTDNWTFQTREAVTTAIEILTQSFRVGY